MTGIIEKMYRCVSMKFDSTCLQGFLDNSIIQDSLCELTISYSRPTRE